MKRFQRSLKRGITLVEVVIASAIILVAVVSVLGIYHLYFKVALSNAEYIQAAQLSGEGLEAVRFMRDASWNTYIVPLSVGTSYGLVLNGDMWQASTLNKWVDTFERTVTLSSVYRNGSGDNVSSGGTLDYETRLVTSSVSWNTGGATTTRSISTYITNIEMEPYATPYATPPTIMTYDGPGSYDGTWNVGSGELPLTAPGTYVITFSDSANVTVRGVGGGGGGGTASTDTQRWSGGGGGGGAYNTAGETVAVNSGITYEAAVGSGGAGGSGGTTYFRIQGGTTYLGLGGGGVGGFGDNGGAAGGAGTPTAGSNSQAGGSGGAGTTGSYGSNSGSGSVTGGGGGGGSRAYGGEHSGDYGGNGGSGGAGGGAGGAGCTNCANAQSGASSSGVGGVGGSDSLSPLGGGGGGGGGWNVGGVLYGGGGGGGGIRAGGGGAGKQGILVFQ